MNKLLIFGILCMIILTGCTNYNSNIDKILNCKENTLNLSCDELRLCDSLCNDLVYNPQQLSCHGYFTNQIIAECK